MAKAKNAQIEARVETVTPDKAREYLDGNYGNRVIRQSWVDSLAGMMLRGEWTTTHQGIAFAPDGRLLDGQHRLLAIVRTGKPVDMLVTRNLSEDAFRHIDGGRTRSNADRVKLLEDDAENAIAVSIVRTYLVTAIVKSTNLVSIDMIDNAFLSMADAVAEVASEFRKAKQRPVTRAPVGAAAVVYLDKHPTRGRKFLEQLVSGRDLPARSPVLLLRESLIAGRIGHNVHDSYWKTVNATRFYHEGREVSGIVAATEDWRGNKYHRLIFERSRRGADGAEAKKVARIRGEA